MVPGLRTRLLSGKVHCFLQTVLFHLHCRIAIKTVAIRIGATKIGKAHSWTQISCQYSLRQSGLPPCGSYGPS
jgi:hypothetical protein